MFHLSNHIQFSIRVESKCLIRNFYRLKYYREEMAKGGTPVLYLNAGDTYTGTPWFTLYKDKIVTEFLNLLKPDAIVSV